eukprot:gene1378-11999_t
MSDENKTTEDKNKIQVSSQKKNLAFYVYLSKKFLATQETVELSGLGNAINIVVSAAEILKSKNYATIEQIQTSSVDMPSQKGKKKTITKAKIQILLKKTKEFENLYKEDLKEEEERKAKKEEAKKEKSEKTE